MKKVYVKYVDAAKYDDPCKEIIGPVFSEACGFLLEDTEDYVTMCQEIFEDGKYRGQLSIPKQAIFSIGFDAFD